MFQSFYRKALLRTNRSSLVRSQVNANAVRSFSSSAPHSASFSTEAKKEASNIRKQLWEFYVSTGRGANALFSAIDLDEKGTVDPNNLKKFMEEVLPGDVEPKEIMPYAWNRLEQRAAAGQDYDARHFKKWLVAATKMSADMKGSRLKGLYSQDPQGLGCGDVSEDEEDATYTWNEETMSQSARRVQYAVRGEVVMKADQLAASGREILYTNIGNPHQVGQKPISYYRQVLSLCDLPAELGVDHPKVLEMFPKDVVERAREYREIIGPSGTGAYTHSVSRDLNRYVWILRALHELYLTMFLYVQQGILGLRKHVAEFIQERDGYPAHPGNIFLTNGASSAIALVLQALLANNNDAIMIPIP